MSSKIIGIVVVVIIAVIGIGFYFSRSLPVAEAPPAVNEQVGQPAPSPVADEERELGAIPVDDLGKEMQSIDAEIAQ